MHSVLNNTTILYKCVRYSLKANQYKTNYFNVNRGVKQGCILSPVPHYSLQNIINHLKTFTKELNKGVLNDDTLISILLYADDIAFLAENEGDLQCLIERVALQCGVIKIKCA